MSMENAILVHAAALDKLADAIRSAYGPNISLRTTPVDSTAGADLVDDKAAELAGATKQRAAKARDLAAADAKQNAAEVKPDAELEQAVAKVEDDAKKNAAAGSTLADSAAGTTSGQAAPSDTDDGLDTPLDYAKDVRPVLLAAIKKAGKDKVQALISTFGVDKADKIDPAKHGELLAGAQKLAA